MSNKKLLLVKNSSGVLECLIITIILSMVIFLLEHPIKYVLFIFGLSLTWLLFLKVSRYDCKFKLSPMFSAKLIDYFFIACSMAVLASNIFANHIVNISFILSVIVSFFLPGWVLLRLLKIDCIKSNNIGLLVLSFSISICITSLVYIFALPFQTSTAAIILSIIYVIISVLPLFKDNFYKSRESRQFYSSNHGSEHNLVDILLLAWITFFFIFVISSLYPRMAYLPTNDIIRHFSSAKSLILAPDTYASQYPWFHFSLASVMELSARPPMWLFQSGIAYLGIMSIFSFYIMAKSYLHDIDRRAPLLATIFFSVFSGFGWLYFIHTPDQSEHYYDLPDQSEHYKLLYRSYLASDSDIGNGRGPSIWFWFRPLTVGFTIFFVLLYLMRHQDLTKHNYIIISSLLILTLSQVHFPELVIFIVFLLVLALFFPTIKLRIKETAISALIGIAASQVINIGYQSLLSFENVPLSYGYQFIIAALSGLSIILVHYPRRPRLSFSRINLTLVTLIALFVYFILLFHWFSNADRFVSLIKDIHSIYSIPLEFYPMHLGIVGVFAIPGIVIVAKKYRSHPIIIFAVLFVLTVVLGRSITYLNANFINTGFWEKRVIELIYASCSLLAPIVVLGLIKQLNHQEKAIKHLKGFKNILVITFLSCLVLFGILSTFLTIELQLDAVSNSAINALTEKQIKQLESSVNNIDPHSALLTVSQRSKSHRRICKLRLYSRLLGL